MTKKINLLSFSILAILLMLSGSVFAQNGRRGQRMQAMQGRRGGRGPAPMQGQRGGYRQGF